MLWLASGSGVPLCSWTITIWWSSSSLFQSRNRVMSWLDSGVGVSLCSWTLTIWWGTYDLLEAGTVWCPGWLAVLAYDNKRLTPYNGVIVWCDEMMFGDADIGITTVLGGTCMWPIPVQVKEFDFHKGRDAEPILWIHQLKENPGDDKSPFTFHSNLGITRWFVATGEVRESWKEEFHFLLGLVESFSSFLVLLRLGLGDDSLLSFSLFLLLTGSPGLYMW